MARRKLWKWKVGPHGATVTAKERTFGGSVYLFAYDRELNGLRKRSLGLPGVGAPGHFGLGRSTLADERFSDNFAYRLRILGVTKFAIIDNIIAIKRDRIQFT